MQRRFVFLIKAYRPVGFGFLDQQKLKAFAAAARATERYSPIFIILSGQDQVTPRKFKWGCIGLDDNDASWGQHIFLQFQEPSWPLHNVTSLMLKRGMSSRGSSSPRPRSGFGARLKSVSLVYSSSPAASENTVRARLWLGSWRNGYARAINSITQSLAARILREMTEGASSAMPLM